MFYIPNSVDGFYNNLHRIRRDLNAILSGEINWDSNNVASTPLECEDNFMELLLSDKNWKRHKRIAQSQI